MLQFLSGYQDRDAVQEDDRELQGSGVNGSGASGSPSWAKDGMASRPSEPQLQKQEAETSVRPQLDFAEPSSGSFEFISQVG